MDGLTIEEINEGMDILRAIALDAIEGGATSYEDAKAWALACDIPPAFAGMVGVLVISKGVDNAAWRRLKLA